MGSKGAEGGEERRERVVEIADGARVDEREGVYCLVIEEVEGLE